MTTHFGIANAPVSYCRKLAHHEESNTPAAVLIWLIIPLHVGQQPYWKFVDWEFESNCIEDDFDFDDFSVVQFLQISKGINDKQAYIEFLTERNSNYFPVEALKDLSILADMGIRAVDIFLAEKRQKIGSELDRIDQLKSSYSQTWQQMHATMEEPHLQNACIEAGKGFHMMHRSEEYHWLVSLVYNDVPIWGSDPDLKAALAKLLTKIKCPEFRSLDDRKEKI